MGSQPALLFLYGSFVVMAITGAGITTWYVPFFMRVHGMPLGQAGLLIGITQAAGNGIGSTVGGLFRR